MLTTVGRVLDLLQGYIMCCAHLSLSHNGLKLVVRTETSASTCIAHMVLLNNNKHDN